MSWHQPTPVALAAALLLSATALHAPQASAPEQTLSTVIVHSSADASAQAGRRVTLRARVDNVADRKHWASVGGFPGAGYLVVGAPRTFSLRAAVEF